MKKYCLLIFYKSTIFNFFHFLGSRSIEFFLWSTEGRERVEGVDRRLGPDGLGDVGCDLGADHRRRRQRRRRRRVAEGDLDLLVEGARDYRVLDNLLARLYEGRCGSERGWRLAEHAKGIFWKKGHSIKEELDFKFALKQSNIAYVIRSHILIRLYYLNSR